RQDGVADGDAVDGISARPDAIEPERRRQQVGLVSTSILGPHLLERDDVGLYREQRRGDPFVPLVPWAAPTPEIPGDDPEPGLDEWPELRVNWGVNLLLGGHAMPRAGEHAGSAAASQPGCLTGGVTRR